MNSVYSQIEFGISLALISPGEGTLVVRPLIGKMIGVVEYKSNTDII